MNPTNVLVLCVDQQSTKVLGCYGNQVVKTPNIDRLAALGTRFTNSYTSCPICVPARASMATGRYVHEIQTWDNAHPYTGQLPSWGHRLQHYGHRAISIGKLHYRNETDDTGFTEQIIPMHVAKGGGDIKSCLRKPLPGGKERSKLVEQLGPGGSPKTRYDSQVTELACKWLKEEGSRDNKPWALFVSQVSPHPPLTPPQEFYDLYDAELITMPKGVSEDLHPWVQAFRNTRNDDDFMDDETRRQALINYYALCSFADYNIGLILQALEEAGLYDTTRIIYTSDHGDNLGARSLWSKCDMYEEAAKIPMIISGTGVPQNHLCSTATSLVDLFPTILESVGIDPDVKENESRGTSLLKIANQEDDPSRVAFSEYHAAASPSAAYMIRKSNFKLIHYEGYRPELFDLDQDPEELNNLASDPAHLVVLEELEEDLKTICDPQLQNHRAFTKQQEMIDRHGGRSAVEKMGWLQGTPVPGEEADHWQ